MTIVNRNDNKQTGKTRQPHATRNGTQGCPKCGTKLEIQKAAEAPGMEVECTCGVRVQLMWKAAIEGEADLFWFEEVHSQNDGSGI